MNAKEVAASRTNAGAYMRVGGAKMFAASESFRKTLAAALYGSGYGELCAAPSGWNQKPQNSSFLAHPLPVSNAHLPESLSSRELEVSWGRGKSNFPLSHTTPALLF